MNSRTDRTIRSNTRCSSFGDVYSSARQGKAFTTRVVFRGTTDKGNSSYKFWEISGRGTNAVTVRWGRVGSMGRSQEIPFYEAMTRLGQKTEKGYRFN